MKINLYTSKGKASGEITIPTTLVAKENLNLIAQAVRVYQDRSHPGLAYTKTRSEVDKTKKKWYKQKGTGGARHGAKSAHIFVGGGVAFGPKGVKRTLHLTSGIARSAAKAAFALRIKTEHVVAIDGLTKLSKTRDAAELIKALGVKGNTLVLFAKAASVLAFRNIPLVTVKLFSEANALDFVTCQWVLVDSEVFPGQKPQVESKSVKATKTVKKAQGGSKK